MIGTNVLESRYDEIMAKPTPSVSGMNSDRSGSPMMNAGMNTDRMQSKASSRGTAVALLACSTAVATFGVCSICTWTFSIVTVASSTRMPIASAMPPSDMMLIVLPVSQSPNSEPEQGERDVGHDDDHAPQVAEEQQDHQARSGPRRSAPRWPRSRRPRRTVGDSSNSKLIVTSLGTASRNSCIDLWMSATTVSVDAVSFLMIGR